ncbi:hypothetical protein SRABI126_04989 [Pedobacter sp. Bi126]|nr:hypothetical protein SRABI126_04989 [Pedobacter sp. Bi126]
MQITVMWIAIMEMVWKFIIAKRNSVIDFDIKGIEYFAC